MQVVFPFQTSVSFCLPAWNCYGSWNRCRMVHPSLFGHSTVPTTKKSYWKQKVEILHVSCEVATSSDAGAEPEKLTTDKRQTVVLRKTGSLPLSVREARLGDWWEVADTHCSAFLPDHGFPMDAVMRLDRVLAMFGSLSSPPGRKRKCLVAVESYFSEGFIAAFQTGDQLAYPDGQGVREHFIEKILGILTVDTVAEYLPIRKSTGLRRSGIAYISNVAVRQRMRRRGIARRLMLEAEAVARSWGSRSIALHCDINNPGAVALYLGVGYKLVKAPAGANWPQPKATPGSEFYLMLKRLRSLQ